MASQPLFRFVHASGLELDRFCSAAGELSHDQGRMLIDAPFRAAERVFETAIRERAELILLTGGTFIGLNPSTWGASFFARQCERVGHLGIQVCWLDAGQERARGWPRFLAFPDNLHVCDAHSTVPMRLVTSSRVLVEIDAAADTNTLLGHIASRPAIGPPPFRIAALTQPPALGGTLGRPVDYWAVASGDAAATFPTAHGMARSAGTVQPRHCDTIAAGGCLLVDVGAGYSLGTQFVETNSVRYHVERLTTDDSTNWEGFRRRLHARTDEILQQTVADAVVFHWQTHGHGPVIDRLVKPRESAAFEDELRTAFGTRRPAAWVAPIVPVPDAVQESRWQARRNAVRHVRPLAGCSPPGDGPQVDLSKLGPGWLRTIDPAAMHVPRPHYQTSLKANARRHAAQAGSVVPLTRSRGRVRFPQ